MNRILHAGFAALVGLSLLACGGGDTGEEMESAETAATEAATEAAGETAGAELSTPEWMQVDNAARTATLDITGGETEANNRWNFNGYANGNATIVVPQGYAVTINFQNVDPANPHSLGIDSRTGAFPAIFENPTPVFEGAITPGAASMTDSTQPNGSATITFTADEAGSYSMVCYVPAHAATGMWIGFEVSADGQAGLRTE